MKNQKRGRYSLLTIAQGEKILKEILSDSLLVKTQGIAWDANKNFHQYFSLNDHGTIQNIAHKIPEEIMDSFCDDYLQILNGVRTKAKKFLYKPQTVTRLFFTSTCFLLNLVKNGWRVCNKIGK